MDVFLLRLLAPAAGGEHGAASGRCAALVWAPLYGLRHHSNLNMGVWARLAALAAARRPTSPAGRPRMHEVPLDRGVCGLPQGLFRPGDVALVHWGDEGCFLPDVHYVVAPPGARHDLKLERCAADTHGAACAPARWRARYAPLVRAARATYNGSGGADLHAPRRRVLYFRGSVRERADEAACYAPNRTAMLGSVAAARCRAVYSMGVRQAVRRELGSHPLLDAGRGGAMGTDTYHRALRGAEWCLTAPGFGFGARLVDYVACGCIPVVVRPGQLWLPYEPELDYRTFAVSLPFEDIPRLPALLEAIPPAVLRAKREALRALHRRFLWDDEYGQAFEAVREAVLLKVK